MKRLTFCLYLLLSHSLFAQQKGATPIPNTPIPNTPISNTQQQTYAVVVGISDYQDDGIPDLRFADKDAEAFANFLRSPAGGSLDEDHLKVLVNEKATAGQLAAALYWLMDECQEGDQAIIYFSGHGDVESETFSQPGYLLCWDAPAKVYMAGGTLAIPMFQLVVSTLSLEKKAKVVIITDACRAGKLAGSAVNGSKLTSSNLSEQFANELKILSCQPDEYSIEGEQWGGGRGAFSYHLVEGLYGMADNNTDLSVSLMEVGRYLQDHVSKEVAPHNQLPMTVGNPREILATVDSDLLEKIKRRREGEMPVFTSTETKGLEEEVLSLVDSTTRVRYRAFKKALTDKAFFEPDTACANYYFNKLIEEPLLAKLHAGMRRNYAAALQDDAQQVVNRYLFSDPEICLASTSYILQTFKKYPPYLQRAIDLLEEDHYMIPSFNAIRLWFEGMLLSEEYSMDRILKQNPEKAIAKYKEALTYKPDMVMALMEIGLVYSYYLSEFDSAEVYYQRGLKLSPDWLNGVHEYTEHLIFDRKDLQKAKIWAEKMKVIDSTSALTNDILGNWHMLKRNFPEAVHYKSLVYKAIPNTCTSQGVIRACLGEGGEKYLKIAVENIKNQISVRSNINSYLGMIYFKLGLIEEAKRLILETRENYRPDWSGTYVNLSQVYFELGEEAKAKEQFELAMDRDPKRSAARWLSWWYGYFPTFGDFEGYFKKIVEWFPDYPEGHYEYAVFLSGKGFHNDAFRQLEEAFALGYEDFQFLNFESTEYYDRGNFAPLRAQKDRWNALMEKYVPVEYQ